ncbi:MAG: RHS repeat-associated core domain-containing protein, partial [Chloroflexi bacterium]|nr:RHS repeat-associated core domain-containing protein [Chloroflexota bacterium]
YAYVYDAVGNMEAYTETVGTDTAIVTRQFDDANQLLISTDVLSGTTSFYYDGNGSLTQILPPGVGGPNMAGALRYGYNQRNLIITTTAYITTAGWTNQVTYRYDGDNNRVEQVDNTGSQPITTTYTNDNTGLSAVLVASHGVTTTVNLAGLDLIQQDNGVETRTLLADGLGSSRVEMVNLTTQTASTYEPFGKLLSYSGNSGTVYGFAGEQYDAAASLVYLRARYYNPTLKVFMSRDPFPGWAGSPASQHGYSYSHNNPVNLIDPTGRNSWPVQLARTCKGNPVTCALLVTLGYVYYYTVWLPEFEEAIDDVWDQTAEGLEELYRNCQVFLEQQRTGKNSEPGQEPEKEPWWKRLLRVRIDKYVDHPDDDNDPGKDIGLGFFLLSN